MQDNLNINFQFLKKIDDNSTYKNSLINKIINLYEIFWNSNNLNRDFAIEAKVILEIVLSNYLIENNYIKEYKKEDLKTLLKYFYDNQIYINGDVYYSIKQINEWRNDGSHEHEYKLNKFNAEIILSFLHKILSYFFNNKQEYIPISKFEEQVVITQTPEQKVDKNTLIWKRNLFEILNEENISFFIPVYQRKYVWNEENIDVLFEDINQRVQDYRDHFFWFYCN